MQSDDDVLAPRNELPSTEFMLNHPDEFAQIWGLLVERTLLTGMLQKCHDELDEYRQRLDEIITAQIKYLDNPNIKK